MESKRFFSWLICVLLIWLCPYLLKFRIRYAAMLTTALNCQDSLEKTLSEKLPDRIAVGSKQSCSLSMDE